MSSVLNQVKTLIWKNFLTKKADKRIFYTELYLYGIIIAFNLFIGFFLNYDYNVVKYYNRTETINITNEFQQTLLPNNDVYMGFVFPSSSKNEENDKLTQYIMQNDVFKNISDIKFKIFQNENELFDFNDNEKLLAGIVFSENSAYNDYTIRMNRTYVPDPTLSPIITVSNLLMNNTEADNYLNYFVPIQLAVDEAILQYKTNSPIHIDANYGGLEININSTKKYSSNAALQCFMFIGCVGGLCLSLPRYITLEKETGIKKTLSLNGVGSFAYYFSWLIITSVMLILLAIVILIQDICFGFLSINNTLFKFGMNILFEFSSLALFMFVSVFFKSSQGLEKFNNYFFTIFMYLPYLLGLEGFLIDIYALDLVLPSIAIFNSYQELYYLDHNKSKISFNFNENSSLLLYIVFLVIAFLFYTIFTVFFDKKFSEENGSLMTRLKMNMSRSSKKSKSNNENMNLSSEKYAQDIEPLETTEKCLVEISDIVKEYDVVKSNVNHDDDDDDDTTPSTISAVDHVNFKVYENEIFGILGHNGAGKSTLINIMTGLIHPNQGNIYYSGQEFFNNKETIRKEFGICPQNCSLFESLTVEQNIQVFARLKEIDVNVDDILREIDLSSKKYDIVGILSGGQKKKLNVGIALMGNPKYVFLDEPSTGLDPLSRRKMWDLLKKNKKGKVIFLTTHYMDEADILTDRKLILHHGAIRCLGTSMYLKKHFNIMYHLKVETNNYSEAYQLIKSHIPEVGESSNEKIRRQPSSFNIKDDQEDNRNTNDNSSFQLYTFKLPTDSSSLLPELIKDLEKHMEDKNIINNFSISLPSLEELFIKLNSDKDEMKSVNCNNNNNNNNNLSSSSSTVNGDTAILIEKKNNLPNYEYLSKPSDSSIISSLASFKYKLYFKSKSFIFYTFIIPIIFSVSAFLCTRFINKDYEISYSPKKISFTELYGNTLWNFNTNQSNINVDVFKSGFGPQVQLNTIESLDILGRNLTDKDQYYAVSISGNNSNDTNYTFDIYYNKTMPFIPPASLNAISNSILQSNNINEKITVSSQPFSYLNTVQNEMGNVMLDIFIALTLFFGSYSCGITMVREKAKGLKNHLFLNQVSCKCYYLSSILVDGSLYFVSCLIVIIAGLALHCDALYHVWSLIIILIIMFIGAFATITNQYVISYIFKKEITAESFLPLINMVLFGIGLSVFLGYSMVKLVIGSNVGLSTILIIFSIIYTIIYPPFSVIVSFNQLLNLHLYSQLNNSALVLGTYLKFNNVFVPVIGALILSFLICYFILLKVDGKSVSGKDSIANGSADSNSDFNHSVQNRMETQERILSENNDLYNELEMVKRSKETMPISVLHLVKEFEATIPANKQIKEVIKNRMTYQYGEIHRSYYNKKRLVRTIIEDVTFGVKEKECFGLLGPNGVGKSTLLNTIIHKYFPTAGSVFFHGVDSFQSESVIGYCSQEDILWDDMSLLDHLMLFLKIRGVTSHEKAKEDALQYIRYCQLTEYMHKPVKHLSGGTKRKLSLLLAVCAYPKQIILDEPTAGIDPATRVFIWDMIKEIRDTGRSSMILTTHSMEEAQELCNRLTILINGRLVCLGSPEYLRMKYASSYLLEIQAEDQERIHGRLFDQEHGAFRNVPYKLENLTNHRYKYQLEMTRTKDLGELFQILEQAKKDQVVQDYTLSQSTLEQVFIDFAKQFNEDH